MTTKTVASGEWRRRQGDLLDALDGAASPEDIHEYSARRIRVVAQRLFDRGEGRLSCGRDVHRLRIKGKKMRYLLESLSSGLPAKQVGACDTILQRIQARFGDFADHAAGAKLVRHWCREESGASRKKLLRLVARQESRLARRECRRCIRWWTGRRREMLGRRLERLIRRRAS